MVRYNPPPLSKVEIREKCPYLQSYHSKKNTVHNLITFSIVFTNKKPGSVELNIENGLISGLAAMPVTLGTDAGYLAKNLTEYWKYGVISGRLPDIRLLNLISDRIPGQTG